MYGGIARLNSMYSTGESSEASACATVTATDSASENSKLGSLQSFIAQHNFQTFPRFILIRSVNTSVSYPRATRCNLRYHVLNKINFL